MTLPQPPDDSPLVEEIARVFRENEGGDCRRAARAILSHPRIKEALEAKADVEKQIVALDKRTESLGAAADEMACSMDALVSDVEDKNAALEAIVKHCITADDPEHHTLGLVKHIAQNALTPSISTGEEGGGM